MTDRSGLPQRVCVLGGSGFVGRHLAAQLAPLGSDIVIPTRHLARQRDLRLLPGVALAPVSRLDRRELGAILRDCDAVVNLIGILNERGHSGAGFRRAHVELAENLVAASLDAGVTRLVQISALKANAEYGASHYLRTKGQAERVIMAAAARGLRPTILRPSVIFGPDDSFINRFQQLLRLTPVLPLARPRATFAPVHVGDVADAIVRVLDDDATIGETYELCGPETYSLLEIVTAIRNATGLRRSILPLRDFLGAAQAFVCDYLVPGKPFSLDNFRSLSVPSTCSSDGLARLGISPRSLTTIIAGLDRHEERLARFRRAAGR
jgi:uncharacterized protein YbjT (DUF2867 family)